MIEEISELRNKFMNSIGEYPKFIYMKPIIYKMLRRRLKTYDNRKGKRKIITFFGMKIYLLPSYALQDCLVCSKPIEHEPLWELENE